MIFAPGTPRIGLLTGGVRTATLWLPMPDAGFPTLAWIEKGQVRTLYDGSEAWRQLGWVPELVLKWAFYDDRATEGFSLGLADGDRPALTDLLSVLSGAPASFSISPGPSAGGFTVQSWKVNPIGVAPGGYAKGLQVTCRGGAIQSSQTLGTF
jgi:hypothetical protein